MAFALPHHRTHSCNIPFCRLASLSSSSSSSSSSNSQKQTCLRFLSNANPNPLFLHAHNSYSLSRKQHQYSCVFNSSVKRMAEIVVVFDFDKTIIDLDSDNWVVDELGFTDLFNQLLPTMPWNSLMDKMMGELHGHGKTIGDIEEVLKRVPIHPRIVPAIKSAHALGCDLRIVSDANQFFIETILNHLGIRECFSEINTNPGYVDHNGRLRILPYHDFQTTSHGCHRCPPNMCKGPIVERIQASIPKEGRKRIIYLGDGVGDFCPSLILKQEDYMMPRKDFPVWDLICKNRTLLKPEIHEWTHGEDLALILLQLINSIIMAEENITSPAAVHQMLSADCKFQTIPMSVHGSLNTMSVPN